MMELEEEGQVVLRRKKSLRLHSSSEECQVQREEEVIQETIRLHELHL
jgi:hypothetical protein